MDQEEDLAGDEGAEDEPVAVGEGLQAAAGRDHLPVLRVPGDEYVPTCTIYFMCYLYVSGQYTGCMHFIYVIIYICVPCSVMKCIEYGIKMK